MSFLNIPVTGGDKISPSTLSDINKKLAERGSVCKLKVGYGSTELGGVLSTTLDHKCYVPGSVGTVLPGGAVKIVDPDTLKELPYNTDGEIYAHSATQMLNYLNNPKETENILHIDENGVRYYKTGDKGHITEDGIVFIVDRYKRLMKRPDGHQVHASPIENVLNSHTDVLQCAVVGISQKGLKTGSIPTAFVVRKQSSTTDEEFAYELDKYCKVRLGERECALAYTFIEKMPYNTMGKIDFKLLEKNTFDTIKAIIVDRAFFK